VSYPPDDPTPVTPAPPRPGYTVPSTAYRTALQPVAPGGQPLAEFWQRLVARLVDALLLTAPVVVLQIIGLVVLLLTVDLSRPEQFLVPWAVIVVATLALSVAETYWYEVIFMPRTGQTVGKRLMGLRVLRLADGELPDRGTATRRWLLGQLAPLVAPYFSWADGLWQLWDQPYRQCLHDKAADTIVIKDVGSPDGAPQ